MEFEWDAQKAGSNERKHGVSFPFAARVFDDSRAIAWGDKRRDYGEPRYSALGMIDGRVYAIAYTLRGKTVRLIAARKGNQRETQFYHDR